MPGLEPKSSVGIEPTASRDPVTTYRVALPPRRYAVAPMMDWTDRHDRYFLRCLSRHAWLYTEMVTAPAVVRGDREKLLGFHPAEHPVALQLGGSDPDLLAQATAIGTAQGYDEINLNVGCPSDRVQSGRFGACLMAEPDLVATCLSAMMRETDRPVTVKCRIGIDDMDAEAGLDRFVDAVADAGVRTVIVHARKAWLQGLSPKENRDIPPLDYDRVYRLKARRPDLEILLNGGLTEIDAMTAALAHVDGVMVGRAAYHDPYHLAGVDRALFGDPAPPPSREAVVATMRDYLADHAAAGGAVHSVTRHMLGLFNGRPGAKLWRRILSDSDARRRDGVAILDRALDAVRAETARIEARRAAA